MRFLSGKTIAISAEPVSALAETFLFVRKVFDQYREKMRLFTDNEVLPGISAMPLLGHTAGHSGYRIESADRSLLIWGDIVHFPQIQIARPDVSIAFDQDPLLSAKTRSKTAGCGQLGQHPRRHAPWRTRLRAHQRKGNLYRIVYEA